MLKFVEKRESSKSQEKENALCNWVHMGTDSVHIILHRSMQLTKTHHHQILKLDWNKANTEVESYQFNFLPRFTSTRGENKEPQIQRHEKQIPNYFICLLLLITHVRTQCITLN